MGLIAESADHSQFTKRDVAGEHEMARPLEASLDHIEVRRLAKAYPKGAREMRHAQANDAAEIREANRQRQMLFDERLQSMDAPGRQST